MGSYGNFPFVRLLFPFATGIVSGISINSSAPEGIYYGVASFWGLYMLMVLFFPRINYSYRWLPGLLINLTLLFAGWNYAAIKLKKEKESSNRHHLHNYHLARITEPLTEKRKSHMAILEILPDTINDLPVKSLAYFLKDSNTVSIEYGDYIIFKGQLQVISPPLNPKQFDYKRFMKLKGVFLQTFVLPEDFKIIKRPSWKGLKGLSLDIRKHFKKKIDQHIEDPENAAIATAMLLGDDQSLSSEQQSSFSSAGAMHVLCVSGLHVGIVYLLLNAFLLGLKYRKWTNIIRVAILISGIWLYALITGMSPSVMRASTMLTFIISGQVMRQKPNIYNSIAASAFFLMITDPCIIYQVGFQLSYLAVLGIVSIQPLFYNLLNCKYWLPEKIWALMTVSLAAQIGTAPLAIYYFHQFPVYFLLTNLIVVPLSSLILYTGFSTFILANIALLEVPIVFCFNHVLSIMNIAVSKISGLSGSVIAGIPMSGFQCLVVYLLLTFTTIWISTANKAYRIFALALIPAITILHTITKKQHLIQEKILIYAIKGHTSMDFVSGRDHIFLADSAMINDPHLQSFHVENHWINSGLEKPVLIDLKNDTTIFKKGLSFKKHEGFIFFNGKSILLIEEIFSPSDLLTGHDLYVIRDIQHIKTNQSTIRTGQIILDGSLKNYQKYKLKEYFKKDSLEFRDIMEDGAYVMDIGK